MNGATAATLFDLLRISSNKKYLSLMVSPTITSGFFFFAARSPHTHTQNGSPPLVPLGALHQLYIYIWSCPQGARNITQEKTWQLRAVISQQVLSWRYSSCRIVCYGTFHNRGFLFLFCVCFGKLSFFVPLRLVLLGVCFAVVIF